MYTIHKITRNTTVNFAAEELKKYLRMMMPRCGEVAIDYDASAPNGFRLGLMQDFDLDVSDVEKPALDDIVYIDTDPTGGIIAGSNPGALLIAVYRYLRFCGCRWLFPGVDGEWIPVIEDLPAVTYRKRADHRYRGQCNEGAEYQQNMLEAIDFTPKIGMNTFMQEFDIPRGYYDHYYSHESNVVWEPEPVSNENVLQWKRQCEAEIQKRGLKYHDMGHGWTAEPFGLERKASPTNRYKTDAQIPDSIRQHLAMVGPKRGLFREEAYYTNVCMGNPETRKIMVDYIADYAEKQNNVDYLHIWLADLSNNHCECDICRTKRPSDWYVILLNEIDAELTKRGLDTHLVFIQYVDTFWGPVEERLRNRDRFTMLYAPISRLYTESYGVDADVDQVLPYVRNKNEYPKGMAACLGYLHKEWKPVWQGDCFCYEYHFWIRQYYDPTGIHIAKIIYDDVQGLEKHGLKGIVEDGSQRSYFPTGLAFYVYGETLFDKSRSFEELAEDYFRHAFGENWRKAYDYLNNLSACFDYDHMAGHKSLDEEIGKLYNPAMAENLSKVAGITAAFAPVIEENKDQPKRASSVLWRMLEHHKDLIEQIARMAILRSLGDNDGAVALSKEFSKDFSAREVYMRTNYDHYMLTYAYKSSRLMDKE